MTENTPTELLEPYVPADVDPVDGLTVRELDIASQRIKCDIGEALQGKDGKRWLAMATIAWLWAKRLDPTTKFDPLLDLHAGELARRLRFDEDQVEADDDANPTGSAPE